MTRAGTPDVNSLPSAKIRDELGRRGLRKALRRGEGVEVLRDRLRQSVEEDIACERATKPAHPQGKFDLVVLR